MMAYELAVNPDIQEELVKEINEVKEQLSNKPVIYEALHKMKFLDMVVSETLRKWPPAPQAGNRITTKPYTFTDRKGHVVKLNPGDNIFFPVVALHYDEKYWPNPKKFDPYRFDDSNKKNIHPGTYLPFGIGRRACIGSRFALMESKLLIFEILRNFSIEVCEKTPSKILFEGVFPAVLKTHVYVELKPRV